MEPGAPRRRRIAARTHRRSVRRHRVARVPAGRRVPRCCARWRDSVASGSLPRADCSAVGAAAPVRLPGPLEAPTNRSAADGWNCRSIRVGAAHPRHGADGAGWRLGDGPWLDRLAAAEPARRAFTHAQICPGPAATMNVTLRELFEDAHRPLPSRDGALPSSRLRIPARPDGALLMGEPGARAAAGKRCSPPRIPAVPAATRGPPESPAPLDPLEPRQAGDWPAVRMGTAGTIYGKIRGQARGD